MATTYSLVLPTTSINVPEVLASLLGFLGRHTLQTQSITARTLEPMAGDIPESASILQGLDHLDEIRARVEQVVYAEVKLDGENLSFGRIPSGGWEWTIQAPINRVEISSAFLRTIRSSSSSPVHESMCYMPQGKFTTWNGKIHDPSTLLSSLALDSARISGAVVRYSRGSPGGGKPRGEPRDLRDFNWTVERGCLQLVGGNPWTGGELLNAGDPLLWAARDRLGAGGGAAHATYGVGSMDGEADLKFEAVHSPAKSRLFLCLATQDGGSVNRNLIRSLKDKLGIAFTRAF